MVVCSERRSNIKIYVFLTYQVNRVGGTQLYSINKARFLSKNGWKVYILHAGHSNRPVVVYDSINYYNFPFLKTPPYQFFSCTVKHCIFKMAKVIEAHRGDRVIIESHADSFPMWGEMLAAFLHGKNICVPLNERYRGDGRCYEFKLDFFSFKFDRGELGASKTILSKLFGDYREISDEEVSSFKIDESPVAEVNNDLVEAIQRYDYNICYIGRIVKEYVPNIVEGVRCFANKHPNAIIQMIFVGDIAERRDEVLGVLSREKNIRILELGNLIPIPRVLFQKVDIVIAGSGSARCAAMEGVPTIVAATNCLSNGLLGYETQLSVNPEDSQTTFCDSLERALILRVQNNMTFSFPKTSVEACCNQNFTFIQSSNQSKEYYSKRKLLSGRGIISLRTKLINSIRLVKQELVLG